MLKLVAAAGALALAGCNQSVSTNATDADNTAAASTTANAAIPDLKGTWSGTSESIVTGQAKHHAAPQQGKPLLDNVAFTYVIDGQDGHRFWGKLSSPKYSEVITGVVAQDGKTVVARTSEGEIRGTFAGPDTLDIIYSSGGPATIVAVNRMTRTR